VLALNLCLIRALILIVLIIFPILGLETLKPLFPHYTGILGVP
jgi:hypothetical protein